MRLHKFLATGCLGFALPVGAAAAGFGDEPFTLRLPAALSRFSGYGDVAGAGGASAGSLWTSSVNPASAAWSPPKRYAVSPQLTAVVFEEGTRLAVGAISASVGSEPTGWFVPAVARVWSNQASTSQGPDFEFELRQVQLQWGKKLSERAAAGIMGSLARSRADFGSPLGPVASSEDRSATGRAGVLYRLAPGWMAGFVGEYGRVWSDAAVHTPFGPVSADDVTRQVLLRPGIAWEYAKESFVYADYQYGRFENGEGTLRVHRAFAGAEHRLFSWLYPRLGGAYDQRGNFSATAGVGLYPLPPLSLDLAYQKRFFPELEPELGPSQTIALSVAWSH